MSDNIAIAPFHRERFQLQKAISIVSSMNSAFSPPIKDLSEYHSKSNASDFISGLSTSKKEC